MSDEFGATFAPFSDPSGRNLANTPVQRAVQLLSLRVPRVVGAAAPAPAALLTSAGGAGRADVHSAVLQTILKTIMGQGAPVNDAPPPVSPVEAPGSMAGSSGAPSPFAAQGPDAPLDAAGLATPPPPKINYAGGPGAGGTPNTNPNPPSGAAFDLPVNNNPIFDPSTNIVPGVDLPLASAPSLTPPDMRSGDEPDLARRGQRAV